MWKKIVQQSSWLQKKKEVLEERGKQGYFYCRKLQKLKRLQNYWKIFFMIRSTIIWKSPLCNNLYNFFPPFCRTLNIKRSFVKRILIFETVMDLIAKKNFQCFQEHSNFDNFRKLNESILTFSSATQCENIFEKIGLEA